MDIAGALIGRTKRVSPRTAARLAWGRLRRGADMAAQIVDELVEPGAVALDIGANWGLFAWALERRVGPSGHVHVFEPHPEHADSLRRMRGGRPNVTVHAIALSDQAGTARLHVPVRAGRRCSYEATLREPEANGNYEVKEVPAWTLDERLPAPSRALDFIKCDVEGHEAALLRGATRTLLSLPTLLIELEQRFHQCDIGEIFGQLLALGYAGYAVRPEGLAPLGEFDAAREQRVIPGESLAGKREYVNDFLFVRPDLDVTRLREKTE